MAKWVFGDDHPTARLVTRLSDASTSAATKQRSIERQGRRDMRVADAALQDPTPEYIEDLSDAELAELREKVCALRNMGASLTAGTAEDRQQAEKYLSKALALQQARLGSKMHPGLLSEIWACVLAVFLLPDVC
jgi:hypothetical protein